MRWGNAEVPVGCVIQSLRNFLEARVWENHPEYGERYIPKSFDGKQTFLVCEFKEGLFAFHQSIGFVPAMGVGLRRETWYVKLLSSDGTAVYWTGESRSHVESWIKSKFVRLT